MFSERIEAVRAELDGHTAALVTDGSNRFYLTGFCSSAGLVLITPRQAYFLTDSRYFELAQRSVSACQTVLLKRSGEQIAALLAENGVNTLLVETERLTFAELQRWRGRLPGVSVREDDALDRLLTRRRAVKTGGELALIRQAQSLTDEAFSYILSRIEPGRTEREIALELEFYMRSHGSEGVAFDFIVVSGKNSSLPHGVPTDQKIARGDFVTMDFGGVVGGYRSDMTRTVAVGEVSAEQQTVYETVLRAQHAGIAAMRAGVRGCDADRAARQVIADAGFGAFFGHGLGHSVGLEIHESPSCAPSCDACLPAGTVMTVEPGIYLPGRFGVRIEDMVVLTQDGCENLTQSPKELIVL